MAMDDACNSHRVIAYFDVDCFYAQDEVLRRSHLRDRPVGVTQKFLVVTCNYVARKCGVPKMAPIQEAKQRCPDIVLINGEDLTPYRASSKKIMTVLSRFGTLERRGLDEAALDITMEVLKRSLLMPNLDSFMGHVIGINEEEDKLNCKDAVRSRSDYLLLVGSHLAAEIRAAVEKETGFMCSSGLASNKMLAKLASSVNKPNMQTCILQSAVSAFLEPLSVRKLPGVGHQTESLLKEMGIATIADLRSKSLQQLSSKFGGRIATLLHDSCRGIDISPVENKGPPKSLSIEDSFQPCTSFKQAEDIVRSLAPDLLARLDEDREEFSRQPKVFTIKWRYPGNWAFKSSSTAMPMELLSRSVSLEKRLETLVEVAMRLLMHSLGKQALGFVVLNIGATNFTASISSNACASHDIRSFLQTHVQASEQPKKVLVSKREARLNREGLGKGLSSAESAHSLDRGPEVCDRLQEVSLQNCYSPFQADLQHDDDFDLGDGERISGVHDDFSSMNDFCSLKKHVSQETLIDPEGKHFCNPKEQVSPLNQYSANSPSCSSSPTRGCGMIVEASRVDSMHSRVLVDVQAQREKRSYNELVKECNSSEVANEWATSVDYFFCPKCGQELVGDAQSRQEHDDYHLALKLDSQEQSMARLYNPKNPPSSHLRLGKKAGKSSNHGWFPSKKSKSRNATLDCFLVQPESYLGDKT